MLRKSPRTLDLLLLVGMAAFPVAVAAQGTDAYSPDRECTASWVQAVERWYAEGRHRESLVCLDRRLGEAPRDRAALLGAARATLVLGYAEPQVDSARAWLRRSIAYGRRALAVDSMDLDGRYVTLAAKGQLALIETPIASARLGREVERDALALLALQPDHAGAHHALGRAYFQIARLPAAVRFVARAWIGGGLNRRATWTAAEDHLRRAVELQPGQIFHGVDLGALLVSRERYEEARRTLQAALEVQLETPQQEGFRRQARALLQQIDRRTER